MSLALPLDVPQPVRLAELEQTIERGLSTFVEVGQALIEIRDNRLYRDSHETFQSYLSQRWRMSRGRAYQLMDGAVVSGLVDALVSTTVDIRPTERAAREMAPLLREEAGLIPEVWEESVRRSDGQPTAETVREVVAERRPTRITSGLMSSESDEWYTPRGVIERLLRMWPVIDLDPASNPGPVRNMPATHHHDIGDSGLRYRWSGRVFLNPPYGDALTDWAEKVVLEERNLDEAVVLVPARTETRWWHVMPADVVCFFKGRLSFFNGATGQTGPAPFPSAALYLGAHRERFVEAFGDAGLIYERVRP